LPRQERIGTFGVQLFVSPTAAAHLGWCVSQSEVPLLRDSEEWRTPCRRVRPTTGLTPLVRQRASTGVTAQTRNGSRWPWEIPSPGVPVVGKPSAGTWPWPRKTHLAVARFQANLCEQRLPASPTGWVPPHDRRHRWADREPRTTLESRPRPPGTCRNRAGSGVNPIPVSGHAFAVLWPTLLPLASGVRSRSPARGQSPSAEPSPGTLAVSDRATDH
jgi:hypothetical protein